MDRYRSKAKIAQRGPSPLMRDFHEVRAVPCVMGDPQLHPTSADPGDEDGDFWILFDRVGNRSEMRDADFRATYERIEEEAVIDVKLEE